MRAGPATKLLLVSALLAAGCGSRQPPPQEPKQQPLSAAPSLQFSGSVIRVADPADRWKFEARSAQVKAAGVNGPYALAPADCRYQEAGQPPLVMHSTRADVDKVAQRVVLEGSVRIESNGWVLEADRVNCDLKTGKVVSPGPTKLTLGRSALARRSRPADGGSRR
jgi:hypothetical protein